LGIATRYAARPQAPVVIKEMTMATSDTVIALLSI
jgi:hypothetical protein